MDQLIEQAGKRWGAIVAVLGALPKAAKVTAARIRDWVRRGLLEARRLPGRGRGLLVVALEDVRDVEQRTRQTTARRGGRPRKASPAAA